jgi:hypothetical protein
MGEIPAHAIIWDIHHQDHKKPGKRCRSVSVEEKNEGAAWLGFDFIFGRLVMDTKSFPLLRLFWFLFWFASVWSVYRYIVLLWISGDDFFLRITMSGAGTVGFGIRIRVGEMGWPGGSGVRLHQCLLRNYHDTHEFWILIFWFSPLFF